MAPIVDRDGRLGGVDRREVVDDDQIAALGGDLFEGPPRVGARLQGEGHHPLIAAGLAGDGGDHVHRRLQPEQERGAAARDLAGHVGHRLEVAGSGGGDHAIDPRQTLETRGEHLGRGGDGHDLDAGGVGDGHGTTDHDHVVAGGAGRLHEAQGHAAARGIREKPYVVDGGAGRPGGDQDTGHA